MNRRLGGSWKESLPQLPSWTTTYAQNERVMACKPRCSAVGGHSRLPSGTEDSARGNAPSMEPDPGSSTTNSTSVPAFLNRESPKARVLETVTALDLRTRRGKKVSPQQFDWILRNPLYEGRMVVSEWGVACQGDFEPIVGQESFRAVQANTVRPPTNCDPAYPQSSRTSLFTDLSAAASVNDR